MSGPVFRHEYQRKTNNKGVHELIKEGLMDGEKGLSFVLTKKVGDKFHRINVSETDTDKFQVKEKIDEKETTKEIDMAELKKMIKSNKDLAFVKNYIENERSNFKGGAKKSSKKASKKGSKKSSKKASKKSSKKGSKKGSKKSSMNGGAKKSSKKRSKKSSMNGGAKKSSKKASKKSSKKASKKGSKK